MYSKGFKESVPLEKNASLLRAFENTGTKQQPTNVKVWKWYYPDESGSCGDSTFLSHPWILKDLFSTEYDDFESQKEQGAFHNIQIHLTCAKIRVRYLKTLFTSVLIFKRECANSHLYCGCQV